MPARASCVRGKGATRAARRGALGARVASTPATSVSGHFAMCDASDSSAARGRGAEAEAALASSGSGNSATCDVSGNGGAA